LVVPVGPWFSATLGGSFRACFRPLDCFLLGPFRFRTCFLSLALLLLLVGAQWPCVGLSRRRLNLGDDALGVGPPTLSLVSTGEL
jgi:hypothetical protein